MSGDIAPTDGLAKLQLDEATGEMVSKNELRKRLQKRARKQAAAEARANKADTPQVSNKASPSSEEVIDPDAMFKQGFLADVFKERPVEEVRTRFPPEPNGFLHLGHAKAIAINFGFARYHGGKTNLRFDDTNPSGEREEFFLAIQETIRWLGFHPDAVTYSSDNFHQLYHHAESLVLKGRAYVCHCQTDELKRQHGGEKGKQNPRYRCAHAKQDPDVNLAKFHRMRDGGYPPRGAFLRMRQDIESPNPQMWDLAAYRIPEGEDEGSGVPRPHYRTGTEWNMYPTYDFAHCVCDSIEGITHSLCTTEFILSRESYEWLNGTLGIYEPMQREFGRLNVTGAVMSKRIITTLVNAQVVTGWDDPRLYTLAGLRRRGVPPGAILAFVNELGVTTARTVIQTARFDQAVRRYLEASVPRLMLVLDPVRVEITNWEDLDVDESELDVPFMPKDPAAGSHVLSLTKIIYIDRADFQDTEDENFFRLKPGGTVGLMHFPRPIRAVSFSRDGASGLITEVKAVVERVPNVQDNPKHIHWVPEGSPRVEARLFSRLFRSDDPKAAEGGVLADINPESVTVYDRAMIEDGLGEVRRRAPWPETRSEKEVRGVESVRFQATRVGYFALDPDSTSERAVLNQIVPQKKDSNKF